MIEIGEITNGFWYTIENVNNGVLVHYSLFSQDKYWKCHYQSLDDAKYAIVNWKVYFAQPFKGAA